jgi:hypothetical protein
MGSSAEEHGRTGLVGMKGNQKTKRRITMTMSSPDYSVPRCKCPHPKVPVEDGSGESLIIDKEMADIMAVIWDYQIYADMCCQDENGFSIIYFRTGMEVEDFISLCDYYNPIIKAKYDDIGRVLIAVLIPPKDIPVLVERVKQAKINEETERKREQIAAMREQIAELEKEINY